MEYLHSSIVILMALILGYNDNAVSGRNVWHIIILEFSTN